MGNVEFTTKETELVSKLFDIVLYHGTVSIDSKEDFKEIKEAVSQVLNKIEGNISEFLR